jgi:hypothetical protein
MADPTYGRPQLVLTGLTISAEFSDKEYGKGSGNFMNISAKAPDPGIPMENIDEVVMSGLDMYFAAWKTLLGTRFATGIIKAAEFKQALQDATLRLESVRKFLRSGVS